LIFFNPSIYYLICEETIISMYIMFGRNRTNRE